MTKREFEETNRQHQAWAEKIRIGGESRAALHQAAAKPKCNRNDCMRDALPGTTGLCPNHYQQYVEARDRQNEDDHNPWHSHPCAEEGCKMDGHEGYGFLCRDHYYERKHDKRRWVKELPGMATLASIVYVPMFVAGILFGWPYIVASWGVLCAGVLGNQTELGLVQGWKRANKPRIPTKGAAKPQPFTLPDVEQP